jgi:hypothetical protein
VVEAAPFVVSAILKKQSTVQLSCWIKRQREHNNESIDEEEDGLAKT